jgi:hypothetical protein
MRKRLLGPASVNLAGSSHQLMLRRVHTPIRLDRFPATVAKPKLRRRVA